MIAISETLLRGTNGGNTRRSGGEGQSSSPRHGTQGNMEEKDKEKVEHLLTHSPPLPAPPILQPAAMQALERDLAKLLQQQQQIKRVSISSLSPLFNPQQPPANNGLALKPPHSNQPPQPLIPLKLPINPSETQNNPPTPPAPVIPQNPFKSNLNSTSTTTTTTSTNTTSTTTTNPANTTAPPTTSTTTSTSSTVKQPPQPVTATQTTQKNVGFNPVGPAFGSNNNPPSSNTPNNSTTPTTTTTTTTNATLPPTTSGPHPSVPIPLLPKALLQPKAAPVTSSSNANTTSTTSATASNVPTSSAQPNGRAQSPHRSPSSSTSSPAGANNTTAPLFFKEVVPPRRQSSHFQPSSLSKELGQMRGRDKERDSKIWTSAAQHNQPNHPSQLGIPPPQLAPFAGHGNQSTTSLGRKGSRGADTDEGGDTDDDEEELDEEHIMSRIERMNAHKQAQSNTSNSAGNGSSGTSITFKIFVPSGDTLRITVPTNTNTTTINDLILLTLDRLKDSTKASTAYNPAAYEMRYVDDDEDDECEVDEDLPPIESNKIVTQLGTKVLALVKIAGTQAIINAVQASSTTPGVAPAPGVRIPQRQPSFNIPGHGVLATSLPARSTSGGNNPNIPLVTTRGVAVYDGNRLTNSNSSNNTGSNASDRFSVSGQQQEEAKIYVKVHIGDHESHVLGVVRNTPLQELLPLISKKKSGTPMPPEHFIFSYIVPSSSSSSSTTTAIDMKTFVGDLQSDELLLSPKLSFQHLEREDRELHHHSSLSQSYSTSSESLINMNNLTLDSVGVYSEYKVIKTNGRGKRQNRIFGMDRYKIYNKNTESSSSSLSSLARRISFDMLGAVSRAERDIASITEVHVVSLRPSCFTIAFKEKNGKLIVREYEAETRMECAEIVAKLKFLMNHIALEQAQQQASQLRNNH